MPYIDKNFIDELQNTADIIAVVGRRISLKKSGANYQACCPFHTEKTPSFSVSASKQLFKCFGCGVAGGVLKFIQQYDHLDFVASVEVLANELRMPIIYEKNSNTPQQNEQLNKELQQKKAHKQLMAQVSQYYEQQLRNHAAKDKVINYVKSRKISGVIAKRFEMGFAPPQTKTLMDDFTQEQYQSLITLGILGYDQHKAGQYYARFRDRLMFPIHNNKGDIIAFGARALTKDAKPKYLNSPETPIFSKSKELYGLYHCRKYSRDMGHILVVEGYMDVVSLHQHDISNVVATLGTATSEAHLTLLSHSTKNIVFCFDGDKAGKKAAWRALEIGLAWLKKGIALKFLFLPDGQDPDTLIGQEGKSKFLKRINQALSLSGYLFKHLQDQVDFTSGEGKTEFTELALEQIAKVQYDLYQEQLIFTLAELSQYSQTIIRQKLAQVVEQKQQRTNMAQKHQANIATLPSGIVSVADKPYDPSQLDIGQYEAYDNHQVNTPKANSVDSLRPALLDIISLIDHYPNIAVDIPEKTLTKIKQFKHGDLLNSLLSNADYDNGVIDIKRLIQPFSEQPYFAQLVLSLTKQCCIDNEKDAKIGLAERLKTLEIQYLEHLIKALKSNKKPSIKEQKKMSSLIQQLLKLKTPIIENSV